MVTRLGTYEVRDNSTGGLLGSFTCTDVEGSQETALRAACDRAAVLRKGKPPVSCSVEFLPSKVTP